MESNTNVKPKSILAGNEKIVSWVIILAIAGFLTWVGIKILPTVITAITNWIIFGLLLGGIGLAIFLLWSFKDIIALRYQLFVKKMWRAVVKSDPISVMEIQWRKWTMKRNELNESIKTMKAGETALLSAMDQKQSVAKVKFAEAKKAQELVEEKNNPDYARKANKNSIIANRLLQSNQNLVPRLKAIQTAIGYCTKLYERWGDDLELLKQDIDLKKDDLQLFESTSNAFDSAKSLLNGNPDERALWEMANEEYSTKIANYVANVTRFTEQAKDWVYDKDLQEAVWEDEGQKLLSMYDQDTFNQLTDFRSLVNKDENTNFGKMSNDFQKVLAQPMTTSSSGTFKDLV